MFLTHGLDRRSELRSAQFGIALLASSGGLMFGLFQAWPLWLVGGAALLPWVPLFVLDLSRWYRHYQWLALFYGLVVTQTGHFFEHVAQMIQIHVLGLTGPNARGIISTLDVEWVHFTWNTWVLVAVLLLVTHFRSNRWLWLLLVLSGWHEIEHAYILSVYITTGVAGTPGLLSLGGALAGGLPLTRPDLHFLYNLLETIPLIAAFLLQARATPRALGLNRPRPPIRPRPARRADA
jgi:hypothetical protein